MAKKAGAPQWFLDALLSNKICRIPQKHPQAYSKKQSVVYPTYMLLFSNEVFLATVKTLLDNATNRQQVEITTLSWGRTYIILRDSSKEMSYRVMLIFSNKTGNLKAEDCYASFRAEVAHLAELFDLPEKVKYLP